MKSILNQTYLKKLLTLIIAVILLAIVMSLPMAKADNSIPSAQAPVIGTTTIPDDFGATIYDWDAPEYTVSPDEPYIKADDGSNEF